MEMIRDYIFLGLLALAGLFVLILLLYLGVSIIHRKWWFEPERSDDDQ